MTAADANTPEVTSVHRGPRRPPTATRSPAPARRCSRTATTSAWSALIKGLEAVDGDVTDQKQLQEALADDDAVRRRGAVGRRQARRQPPGDLATSSSRRSSRTRPATACRTCRRSRKVPDVDQTFDGVFSPDDARRRTATNPKCEKGDAPPWVGNAEEVDFGDVGRSGSTRDIRRRRRADPPLAGGRPALRRRPSPCRDVDLEVRPGERRAILGPNGAGKTTLFNLISGEFPPTAGTVELFGRDVTGAARPQARAHGALAHVPDVAPVRRPDRRGQPLPGRARRRATGTLRIVPSARTTASCASKARAMAEAVGLTDAARRARRRALARRAAPARGRHGARRRPAS